MPRSPQHLGRYTGPRQRAAGVTLSSALKLAKEIVKLKRDYTKKRTPPKETPRAAPKKYNAKKPKIKLNTNKTFNRNITAGPHTYSKIGPKSYKATEMAKKFPQILYQTYYITSPETYTDLNPGVDGTITNPDMLYSEPSVLWTNSSIHLFNIHNTEKHWVPTQDVGTGYRTGTQLTNVPADPDRQLGTVSTTPNDSFIFVNDPINTKLVSV